MSRENELSFLHLVYGSPLATATPPLRPSPEVRLNVVFVSQLCCCPTVCPTSRFLFFRFSGNKLFYSGQGGKGGERGKIIFFEKKIHDTSIARVVRAMDFMAQRHVPSVWHPWRTMCDQGLPDVSQPSVSCLVPFFKSVLAILQSTCCCCRTQRLPSKI